MSLLLPPPCSSPPTGGAVVRGGSIGPIFFFFGLGRSFPLPVLRLRGGGADTLLEATSCVAQSFALCSFSISCFARSILSCKVSTTPVSFATHFSPVVALLHLGSTFFRVCALLLKDGLWIGPWAGVGWLLGDVVRATFSSWLVLEEGRFEREGSLGLLLYNDLTIG